MLPESLAFQTHYFVLFVTWDLCFNRRLTGQEQELGLLAGVRAKPASRRQS